jgi:hypothetical protein
MFAKMPFVKAYQKWDKHLLLNHPRLWALRLPVLVSYFIIFNLVSILVSSLVPLKTYHVNHMFTWLWIFGVVEAILLVLWIRRFNWFSPKKSLERAWAINGLGEVVIYMLCILIFFSPTIFSSIVLETRFAHMLPLDVIETDRAILGDYYYDDWYAQRLVERYTRFDYETYLDLEQIGQDERYRVNYQLEETIRHLLRVTESNDYRWQAYLTTTIVLLNLAVILFGIRHIRRNVLGKALIYAVAVGIFSLITELILWSLSDFLYRGDWDGESHFHETAINWYFVFLIAFILFFSLRVFWQKRYRVFTAMNITLLPFGVFAAQLYFLDRLSERYPVINDFFFSYIGPLEQAFGFFWGEIIQMFFLASPLLILWVFILNKAMYTRLLSLPEG